MGGIMHNKYNSKKSLGSIAAHLVTTLYDRNRLVFHFKEAEEILEERSRADKALTQLTQKGIVTRLKPGLFQLVPFELGSENEYMGNQYNVARELALSGRKSHEDEYYISYGSAFELHQMTTQPQFVVYISSTRISRPHKILGTEFRFVLCKKQDIFGITELWVDKSEKIRISDLERTLLDGLKHPLYCGGFIEVAKAFSIKHQDIDTQKLIDYAVQLNVGAVYRRLGFLMELYNIGQPIHLQFLQTKLTNTYQLLDPDLPAEGSYIAKWRLRLNITPEELIQIRAT